MYLTGQNSIYGTFPSQDLKAQANLDFSQAKPIVITDFPMNSVPLGLKKKKKKRGGSSQLASARVWQ